MLDPCLDLTGGEQYRDIPHCSASKSLNSGGGSDSLTACALDHTLPRFSQMSSGHTERLEALISQSRTAAEPEVRVALSRLGAEIKERLNHGSSASYEFFSSAADVLSRIAGSTNAELRFDSLHGCAHFFYQAGHRAKALETATRLHSLATQIENELFLRKALVVRGIVLADCGDVGQALLHYANALELARRIGDRNGEVIVMVNVAVAFNYSGLYSEAIPYCEWVLALPKAEIQPPQAAIVLSNLAQAYLYLGEYSKGLGAIEECVRLSAEPSDNTGTLDAAIREFTYVQLALELGDVGLARERSELCSRFARWDATPRARFVADISAGLCEVHGGNGHRGLEMLETALIRDGDAGQFRADALSALVRAYDQVGRIDDALLKMRELLQHLRETRDQSMRALATASHHGETVPLRQRDQQDLRGWELREARLRARVAENQIAISRIEMLERLAVAADLKEESSGEHGYRVGKLASLVAGELGWTREACFSLELAGRLHDIGKIGVPDRILLKSQELRHAERHFMSTHTVIGAELLANSDMTQLRIAEDIARAHHESWDGSGYPRKLAGKRIPVHARIVALCDVFDALTHGRPYAEPWPIERALDEIRLRRGTQFDPQLTDRFVALVQRLRTEHLDLDAFLGKAGRNSPFLRARNKIRFLLAEERDQVKKAASTEQETVQ